jgi:hypothetical protein
MKSALVSAERRCADLLEKGTESIQLVKQVQDDSDALIVHPEINFEFLDE